MRNLRIIFLGIVVAASIISSSLVMPTSVLAKSANPSCKGGQFFGLPTWYKYLDMQYNSNSGICEIADDRKDNAPVLIGLAVVEMLITLAAVVAVVMIVYAGFMFVSSQGSPDKIAGARKTILNAVIGLVITLVATQFVRFIAGLLAK